nr:MAG TPA: TOXIN OF TOXIN-ANTITOXIN SYSTEM, ANTITOXIN-TOXIN-DNA COMPLEX, PROTEIN-DNA COMPLEX [Caudoviricetes sp.]
MIKIEIAKSRLHKKGNSAYITIPKDTEDEELLSYD